MKNPKALSSNIHPGVGRESIHNIGSINTALLGIEKWGHSMSNQRKKILTLIDLNETWFLHSVC